MSQQTRDLIAGFESRLWHFQIQTTAAERRINALPSSTSWRATAPLGWQRSTGMRNMLSFPWRVFKRVVRTPMLAAMNFVLQRPPLRRVFSAAIKRHPRLAHHLHLLAIHRGLMEKPSPPLEPPPSTHETTAASDVPATPLTPHAQRIHEELVRAIAQQNARDT
jgi:O-antigen chain-terminating methyltransferase